MQKKLIIANWKSHKTTDQALEWLDKVGSLYQPNDAYDVVVCPSFLSLPAVAERIKSKGYSLSVGAQNVSAFDSGAYTGEVNAKMISEFASYTLIGHSERRQYFYENNEDIDHKVSLSLQYGLTPVVLVRDERDTIPAAVTYFAWEPVSAIGTGKSIDPSVAVETVRKLRGDNDLLVGMYGGSVNKDSIGGYMSQPELFGVVVGGASLEADSFLELLHAIRPS